MWKIYNITAFRITVFNITLKRCYHCIKVHNVMRTIEGEKTAIYSCTAVHWCTGVLSESNLSRMFRMVLYVTTREFERLDFDR